MKANKTTLYWREFGYVVRQLSPSDASETYLNMLANADLMAALNMPARRLSLTDLRSSISAFDQRENFLVGVFKDSAPTELAGVFVLTLNLEHRILRASGFVNPRVARPKFFAFVRGFMGYLFEQKGVEKIGAQVATTNKAAIAALVALGLRREGKLRGEIRKFDGSTRIDQFVFGLLRDEWRMRQKMEQAKKPSEPSLCE